MKKLIVIFLVGVFIQLKSQNPVHFSLHSHNEIQDAQAGITYSVKATYDAVKATALKIRDTVQKYGVKWNMQVESNFILACIKHDSAYFKTNDFYNPWNHIR